MTLIKYKDRRYYWTKTEAKGNYGKRMRQLIDGSKPEEVFFDGDLEKKKSGSEYFGLELLVHLIVIILLLILSI